MPCLHCFVMHSVGPYVLVIQIPHIEIGIIMQVVIFILTITVSDNSSADLAINVTRM